jgi:hypothetical protein
MKLSHAFRAALALASALLSLAVIPAAAQTRPVSFPTPTTFQSTSVPGCSFCPSTRAVATGDFNGDGKLDVVNTDTVSDINVALGNGDGTFQLPVITDANVGVGYFAIATGDFNGDHLLDVALWGVNTNMEVHIYLGNGNGTFTAGGVFTAAGSGNSNPGPSSLVAADVNGDGKLDLVAVTDFNGVFVFPGNGDGSFQTATGYSSGTSGGCCTAVAVGDLNGDGKLDIAVAISLGISVLLNNGSGTFGAAVYYPANIAGAFTGDGIAIGDVNGDKKADVVVTAENLGAIVFLNQGTGTFVVNGTVGSLAMSGSSNVLLVDINNDKKLDIVMPDASGNVFTFLGKNNGTFTTGPDYPLQVASNSAAYLVAMGDFNGDGALDLLDTNGINLSTVSLGRGDGSFRTGQLYSYTTAFFTGHNVVAADFNGDGYPDAAYSYVPLLTGTERQSFALLPGSSHGALGAPAYIAAGSCSANQTNWIAAGDVNGDGKADVVTTLLGSTTAGCQLNTVAVLGGLGTGKFKAPVYYSTGAASTAQEEEVFLVDVNGDGKLDIITSNSDGTISVLLNKGNGTYKAGTLITSVAALAAFDNPLTFADFNGDGKTDIAVVLNPAVSATSVYVLPGNGNGTFGSPIQTAMQVFPTTLVAGDFDKDGKVDVLVPALNFPGCVGSSYVFGKGNGNGTFAPGTAVCVPYLGSGYPMTADFNADGNLDVVIPYAGNTNPEVGPAILQGNGNGTFQASALYYSGQAAVYATIGDFNNDGVPDVVLLNDGGFGASFLTEMLNASLAVSVSPLNTNYGSVTVGTPKALTVTLTNNQTKSLAITSMTLTGTNAADFTQTNNCGTSRKPGWDCTVTVTFTPTAIGARTATLNILDAVGTQTVQLNGTGQ